MVVTRFFENLISGNFNCRQAGIIIDADQSVMVIVSKALVFISAPFKIACSDEKSISPRKTDV
jgi:hypothetical protein